MDQASNNDQVKQEFADREIDNVVAPAKQVKLYIYPLMSLFKDNDDSRELLTYSPNVVNIKIIDKDIFQEIDAEEIENPKLGYVSKQALNSIDNELAIVDQIDKSYATHQNVTRESNRLYLVSEAKIEEEQYISVFGQFLQQILKGDMVDDESYLNQTIIQTTSFEAWKPKDSNQIIVKMGKQIDNFKIDTIEINHPKTFLIEGLKVLASDDDGEFGYAEATLKNQVVPLYTNPIEISFSGKTRLLNLWMSQRIFDVETVKKFVASTNTSQLISDLLYIKDDEIKPPVSYPIYNVQKISVHGLGFQYEKWSAGIGGDFKTGDGENTKSWVATFDTSGQENMSIPAYSDNEVMTFGSDGYAQNRIQNTYPPSNLVFNNNNGRNLKLKEKQIDYIEVVVQDAINQSSLLELLLEELSACYNYSFNFKGAGYINNDQSQGLNEMAIYKQQFDGKTIAEYIESLDRNWELAHPDYVNLAEYENFKKIKVHLSGYLFGNYAIGNNMQSDYKFLLPYFIEILSKPSYVDSDNQKVDDINSGNGVWKYSAISVRMASLYFDLNNLEQTDFNLTSKDILNSNDDTFIWQEIKNEVEEAKLPSLKNSDLKISDVNVTKNLCYISKENINLYGKSSELIVNKDFVRKNILSNGLLNFTIDGHNNNPKFIELTGYYGSGSYSFTFKTSEGEKTVVVDNIQLFSADKENIALVKIAF